MKKILKTIFTVLVMALMCIVGAIGGAFLGTTLFSGNYRWFETLAAVLCFVIGFYFSIIVHEGGHLVFGLLSGYGFSSFRIGPFMWIKQGGSIRLKRLSIAGTGGQCLMTPPDKNDIPVILYNLGGVFANLILTGILLLGSFLLSSMSLVSLVLFLNAIISFVIALTNGLPLDIGGISNDGMNALHLSASNDARLAFKNQLLMSAAQASGLSLSEMPSEWFSLPEGADMQNVHCASVAVFSVNRVLESGDYLLAEREIDSLLKSNYNVIGLHRSLLKCDLIFLRLVNNGRNAEISSLLTVEQQKFIRSMKSLPSILRTEYAIAIIRDNDAEKGEKIKNNLAKIAKKYPYPTDIKTEMVLIDAVDKMQIAEQKSGQS